MWEDIVITFYNIPLYLRVGAAVVVALIVLVELASHRPLN